MDPPNPHPFLWAQPYNPGGSMGLDPNGLGGVAAQLMTPYLMQFAGPTNFLPHQNPAQAVADQLAMRQHFNNTQANTFGMARAGTGQVAERVAGFMSLGSEQPLTNLNRQQAHGIAEMANNPYVKMAIGQFVGPENLEAMMFGTRGDPSMIGAATNRIGYYRPDSATGARRMSGRNMEDFSRGVYASLYEPSGNIEEMVTGARAGNEAATTRLKKAARAERETVVADDDLTKRIADMGAEAVGKMYDKYRPGGEATTIEARAKELAGSDRAIKEAGVLSFNETSIAGLQKRAERASVEGAHGFMAGETAQVMEHMFQRGMLPQSIGALSPAERVKVLASQELDDETTTRLAREFGHRDLMANNEEYAAADRSGNRAAQQTMLEGRLGGYKDRIKTSLKAAKDEAADGQVDPEKAHQLLSMDGMDSVASNVDANRVGGVVKKHTEALAAIRQIFGDNGNPNAPVPALLAALDHLSQGAASRMNNTSRVASTMREMRNMAKEMGMGFPELAGMAAGINALGDQYGLSRESKVEAHANTMAMVNSMRKSGVFDPSRRFGGLTEAEAKQKMGVLSTRTEASMASLGTAAIKRIYAADKEKHKGTELGEIARRLEDPNWDGSYEWGGKKKNYFQDISGPGAAGTLERISTGSGERAGHIGMIARSKQTREFAEGDDSALKAAKHELVGKVGNRAVAGSVAKASQGGLIGGKDKASIERRQAVTNTITQAMIDSSDAPTDAAQLDQLEKELPGKIAAALEEKGLGHEEAKAEAERIMRNKYGDTPEKRRSALMAEAARVDVGFNDVTHGEIETARAAKDVMAGLGGRGAERAEQKRQADLDHRLGTLYSGNTVGRLSDALAEAGKPGAGKFDAKDLFMEAFGVKSEDELRKIMAPELMDAINREGQQFANATISERYIQELAAGKAVTGDGRRLSREEGMDELREIAKRGMNDDQKAAFDKQFEKGKEVTTEQLAARRADKVGKLTGEKLVETYKKTVPAGAAKDEDAMRAELVNRAKSNLPVAGFETEKLMGEGEFTADQLTDAAAKAGIGGAKMEGREDEYKRQRDLASVAMRGLHGVTEEDAKEGALASLESAGLNLRTDERLGQLMKLGMHRTGDKDAEKAFTDYVGANFDAEQQKLILGRFNDARNARDAHIGDRVTADSALPGGGTGGATSPGGASAAKDVAAGTGAGGMAAGTARDKAEKDGPLNADKAEAEKAAETKAKGPGAETAKDVAKESGPAHEPGKPVVAGVDPKAVADAMSQSEAEARRAASEYAESGAHPGSAAEGKAVAEGGGKGGMAAATAKDKADKDGPLSADKNAKNREAALDQKGAGARTATNVGKPAPGVSDTTAPKPGQPAVPDIAPHPGSADAGQSLKAGTSADPAQAQAKQNESTEGPLNKDRAAKAAAGKDPNAVVDQAINDAIYGKSPGSGGPGGGTAAAGGNEALASEVNKLTEAIKGLEKPFRDLIDAMSSGRQPTKESGLNGSMARNERFQLAQAARVDRQTSSVQQRSTSSGSGGGGGGSIKGTLTLIGLQNALLSARGSPVFTPTGDGPSIVPGNPVHGAYLSSANVAPVAEA